MKTKAKNLVSKASDVMRWRPKPTLSVDAKDLPAIKDWAVGKTYTMVVKAKMTEMRDPSDGEYTEEEGRPASARFRILSVKESDDY